MRFTLSLCGVVMLLSFAVPSFAAHTSQPNINTNTTLQAIMQHPEGLNRSLLTKSLRAYQWAEHHSHVRKPYLTIVDFSIPSKYPRLWVIDLKTNRIVDHTLVANGRNSGLFKGTRFSNRIGSNESSLGIYLTGQKFYSGKGLSMFVYGLQPGINSNAATRQIIMHANWYVSKQFAKEYGRIGRSDGCFTLSKRMLPQVIRTIKNGSVLYAYADNQIS